MINVYDIPTRGVPVLHHWVLASAMTITTLGKSAGHGSPMLAVYRTVSASSIPSLIVFPSSRLSERHFFVVFVGGGGPQPHSGNVHARRLDIDIRE